MATFCHILVRNVRSNSDQLVFPDFVLRRIDQGDQAALTRARNDLGAADIYFGDWVLTRQYQRPGCAIAEDAEDLLFLLRLFRPGELAFVRLCMNYPSTRLPQHPYRVISPLVGNSSPDYRLDTEDIDAWLQFRKNIQEATSWSSAWVRVCKKFFLYGTSVEFNLDADELDRIVNYMMALEAALVPEKDFVSARLKERALRLVQWDSDEDKAVAKKALSELYSVRSTIAHGSRVGDKSLRFLREQRVYFESLVRRILQQAILRLPATDGLRKSALDELFVVTEQKRAGDILEKFRAVSSRDVREALLFKLQSLDERSRGD
jgi:hypothetical protein